MFGERTVERLLRLIKPDVHCKGTDYTVDSVPERAVVLEYGGRTAIVGDPKNHATRELIERIAAAARRLRPCRSSSSSGSARSATSSTRFRWRRRCGARFPGRGSTGWSARSTARFSISCRSSIGAWSSTIAAARPAAPRCSLRCASCAATRYDVAIDLQGLIKSAAIARMSGAARVIGFSTRHLREPLARPFYTEVHDPGGGGMRDRTSDRARRPPQSRAARRRSGSTPGRPSFRSTNRRRRSLRSLREETGGRYALLNPGRRVAEQALAAGPARGRGRRPRRAARAAVGRALGTG